MADIPTPPAKKFRQCLLNFNRLPTPAGPTISENEGVIPNGPLPTSESCASELDTAATTLSESDNATTSTVRSSI